MNSELAPADLVAEVRAAPTAEQRAVLLGVNLPGLVRTASRLRFWAVVVCIAPALVALVSELMLASGASSRGDFTAHLGIAAGVLLVLGLSVLAFAIAAVIGAALRRVLTRSRANVLSVLAFSCLELLALFIAVRIAGTGPLFLGAVDGAILAPLLQVSGAMSLLVMLRSNHPKAVEAVRAEQSEPSWRSLLGGRVRWIVAALVVSELCSEAALLIFESAPVDFAPVTALTIAAGVAAVLIARRGNPWGWLGVQVLAAAVLIAVAFVVSL